jgi:hypothetical protein
MIGDKTKYAIIPIEYDEETRNYIVMYNNNELQDLLEKIVGGITYKGNLEKKELLRERLSLIFHLISIEQGHYSALVDIFEKYQLYDEVWSPEVDEEPPIYLEDVTSVFKAKELKHGVISQLGDASKEEKKEKIATSDEYINWLSDFSQHNPVFSSSSQISDDAYEDKKNIRDLSLFWDVLNEYANRHKICCTADQRDVYYNVTYRVEGYRVFKELNSSTVTILKSNKMENAISFEDVLKENQQEKGQTLTRQKDSN